MFNGNPNQYQYNAPMGQMYNQSQVAFTQPLTQEEIDALRKDNNLLSLKVSKEELDRSICTHKYLNSNTYAAKPVDDGTGDLQCDICGARFNPDELSPEKVEQVTRDMYNILQSCKLMYVNIPPNAARQYFSMIPFIEKVPKMYRAATENFQRYSPVGNTQPQTVYGQNNIVGTFKNVVGGYAYPNMGYQNPYQNQPQYGYDPNMMNQQPTAPQYTMPPYQPQGQPQYGYDPNMMNQQYNPYATQQMQGYGGYQPQGNPFMTNGMNQAPPVQQNNQQNQNTNNSNVQKTPQSQAVERVNASATLEP